ncbi:MAG: hypothetical protein JWN78_1618 [Bacteroidota bacterium]|nr:hypothetical protein [Bacteroidota bacterium]
MWKTKAISLNKIAIVQLSSSRIQILYISEANEKYLKSTFSFFDYDITLDEKINILCCLNGDDRIDILSFKKNILGILRKLKFKAEKNNVTTFYPIGTEIFRNIHNRLEVIEVIKREFEGHFEILTNTQESEAIIKSFFISKPSFTRIKPNQSYLYIHGYGVSTKIIFFKDRDILYDINLTLGPLLLLKSLLQSPNINIKEFLTQVEIRITKVVNEQIKYTPTKLSRYCIGSGTIIEEINFYPEEVYEPASKEEWREWEYRITKKQSDNFPSIHIEYIELSHIGKQIALYDESIITEFGLIDRFETINKELEEKLLMRLGLTIYMSVMKKFAIKAIIVNCASLSYSILWDKLGLQSRNIKVSHNNLKL